MRTVNEIHSQQVANPLGLTVGGSYDSYDFQDTATFGGGTLHNGDRNNAISKGFDEALKEEERSFLYMPFQHSENLDDQNRAVLLFSEIGNGSQVGYAKHHRDIIKRFGRFPHRNAILGRESTPAEVAFLAEREKSA